jgi:hypothetical protein
MTLEAIDGNITKLRQEHLEPPRRSTAEGIDEFLVRRVRVVTVGTPVQGPDIAIPKGYDVVIRMRRHAGTPNGYVSGSAGAVRSTESRVELRDNDSITVRLSNMKEAWFDADTATTDFEMIVEM